jgi:predicted SnoaL-like aldol condensation-catalyzing enzyme
MRLILAATLLLAAAPAYAAPRAGTCRLSPKQVVTRFMDEFYVQKHVRSAFERWVAPSYIQHNPFAQTGRDAAIAFLEPFVAANPDLKTEIKRVIADGNLVAVHSHGWSAPGKPGMAVVDIFRVRGCRVMEHWDVVQPVPEKSSNTNTMF